MTALVCDICGGKLVMQSGGVAKCDSCGMEYTKERIQEKVQEIKGTVKIDGPVETVKGDAEKERLLNMANDCLNKGNLEEAKRIYTTVSKEYSNDWRGWWGIICSTPLTENLVIGLAGISQSALLEHEYTTALSFAPDNKHEMINQNKQQRLKNIEKIKLQNQIKGIQNDIQITEGKIKNIETMLNKKEKEYNTVKTTHIIGVIFIIIAIIMFLAIKTTMGTVISIIVFVVGIIIWNFLGNGDYQRKNYEKVLSEINDLKLKKETLQNNLKRFQNELNK